MPPWCTGKGHSDCPHGAASLGGHTKSQNALDLIKLGQPLPWPGVLETDL